MTADRYKPDAEAVLRALELLPDGADRPGGVTLHIMRESGVLHVGIVQKAPEGGWQDWAQGTQWRHDDRPLWSVCGETSDDLWRLAADAMRRHYGEGSPVPPAEKPAACDDHQPAADWRPMPGSLFRIEVPGGWLYRMHGITPVFVPKPPPSKADAAAMLTRYLTVEQQHAIEAHPAFEYRTTEGPRKAWDAKGSRPYAPDDEPQWERNVHRGDEGWERFDAHEEAYWMRRVRQ